MMKRIIIILILSSLIFSCGKKGDPEYKVSELRNKIQTTLKNLA